MMHYAWTPLECAIQVASFRSSLFSSIVYEYKNRKTTEAAPSVLAIMINMQEYVFCASVHS